MHDFLNRELFHLPAPDVTLSETAVALERLGEILLNTPGDEWTTAAGRSLRRAPELTPKRGIYESIIDTTQAIRRLKAGEKLTMAIGLTPDHKRVISLTVCIISASEADLILCDPSPESEDYRDRLKPFDHHNSIVGYPSLLHLSAVVSASTYWHVKDIHDIYHSGFWLFVFSLSQFQGIDATNILYTILMPGIALRKPICRDYITATVAPSALKSVAPSAFSIALFTLMSIADYTFTAAKAIQYPLLVYSTAVSELEKLHKIAPSVAQATICNIADNFTKFLANLVSNIRYIPQIQSETISKALQVANHTHMMRTPLPNILATQQPAYSSAFSLPDGTVAPPPCPVALNYFGMLLANRFAYNWDTSSQPKFQPLTHPDLTVVSRIQITNPVELTNAVTKLAETLMLIENQKSHFKHHMWLQHSLTEYFIVKVLPRDCYSPEWCANQWTLSVRNEALRVLLEVVRFFSVCTTRICGIYSHCSWELTAYPGSVIICSAAMLLLTDNLLRRMTVDCISPFALVYGPNWMIESHGLAELTSNLAICKPELLNLRRTILDCVFIRKRTAAVQLFAFEARGTSFSHNEVTFVARVSITLGLFGNIPVSERRNLCRNLIISPDENHLWILIPEWRIARDISLMAKFVISLVTSNRPSRGKDFDINCAIPRWKYVAKGADDESSLNFRVSFLGRAGSALNSVLVSSRLNEDVMNMFCPSTYENHTDGTLRVGRLKPSVDKFLSETSLKIPQQPNSAGPTAFTAISKYITGFWETTDIRPARPLTSISPGEILSESSKLTKQISGPAFDQGGVETIWTPVPTKLVNDLSCERDVLGMKRIPILDKHLNLWDTEVLLSLFSAPYVRITPILDFMNHSERIMSLSSPLMQELIFVALFECGPWKNIDTHETEMRALLLPSEIPAYDETDRRFVLGTRQGLMMTEIIFNSDNLVRTLVDLLLHSMDKDNGKLDISENEALLVVSFLARVGRYIVSFCNHLISEDLENVDSRVSDDCNLLRRTLIRDVRPFFEITADRSVALKRPQTTSFCRSNLTMLYELELEMSSVAASEVNLVSKIASNLFYAFAHRPFVHSSQTFEQVADDISVDEGDSADEEHATSSLAQVIHNYGITVGEHFEILTRVRLPLIELCETKKTKKATPESSPGCIRDQICDDILKVSVGDNNSTTESAGNWTVSNTGGLLSGLLRNCGGYIGRYSRGTSETEFGEGCVQLDFQVGEVSFLGRGFQLIGDWIWNHDIFSTIIKTRAIHCAQIWTSKTILHLRLIGVDEYDVVRFQTTPAMEGIIDTRALDKNLADGLAEIKSLKIRLSEIDEIKQAKAKIIVSKKELKQLQGRLEEVMANLCSGCGWTIQKFYHLLWDGKTLDSFSKWKTASKYCNLQLFRCKYSAVNPTVHRFLSFIEILNSNSVRNLAHDQVIEVSNVREIIYYEHIHLVEVYSWNLVGTRIYRTADYTNDISASWIGGVREDLTAASPSSSNLRPKLTAVGSEAPGNDDVVEFDTIDDLPGDTLYGEIVIKNNARQSWGKDLNIGKKPVETIWILKSVKDDVENSLLRKWNPKMSGLEGFSSIIEGLRHIESVSSKQVLCVDKASLNGLLPLTLLDQNWWQHIPRISTSMSYLIKNRDSVPPVLRHCLKSKMFLSILCLIEEPLSIIFNKDYKMYIFPSPESVSYHCDLPEYAVIKTFLRAAPPYSPAVGFSIKSPPGPEMGRLRRSTSAGSGNTPTDSRSGDLESLANEHWWARQANGILLDCNAVLNSGNDGTAMVQTNSGLTLVDPRLDRNEMDMYYINCVKKLDNVHNIRFWTTAVPDLGRLNVMDTLYSKLTSENSGCKFCGCGINLMEAYYKILNDKVNEHLEVGELLDYIEVPRIGLSFRSTRYRNSAADKSRGGEIHLYCDQHDGYYISRRRHISKQSLITTLLGSLMNHGVLLESNSGDLILLLSIYQLPVLVKNKFFKFWQIPLYLPNAALPKNINYHFIYKIHSSRTFIYSPDPLALFILLILRWLSSEYQESVDILYSANLIQYIKNQQSTHSWIWHVLDQLNSKSDGQNPDGIGIRLKALVNWGCFITTQVVLGGHENGLDFGQYSTQSNTTTDRLPLLPNWESGVDLYRTYTHVFEMVKEDCRLTMQEEQRILNYIHFNAPKLISYNPIKLRYRVLVEFQDQKKDIINIMLINRPYKMPACPLDSLNIKEDDYKSLTSKVWENIQKVQGFFLNYRRPGHIYGGKAVEYILQAFTSAKLASPPAGPNHRPKLKTTTSGMVSMVSHFLRQDLNLSLSRDWLLIYDLLTEGFQLKVQDTDSSYLFGYFLARFISPVDLQFVTRMSYILKYLCLNKNYALTSAPKYQPELSDNDKLQSKLGLTLRNDSSFKSLLEELDRKMANIPPIQLEPAPDSTGNQEKISINVPLADVPAIMKWCQNHLYTKFSFTNRPTTQRRRQLQINHAWIQPIFKQVNAFTDIKSHQQTHQANSQYRFNKDAELIRHLEADIQIYMSRTSNATDNFNPDLPALKSFLMKRFCDYGNNVDQIIRSLGRLLTHVHNDEIQQIMINSGLKFSFQVPNLTQLLLHPMGNEVLLDYISQNLNYRDSDKKSHTLFDEVINSDIQLMILINNRNHIAECLNNINEIESLKRPNKRKFLYDQLHGFVTSHRFYVHPVGECAACGKSTQPLSGSETLDLVFTQNRDIHREMTNDSFASIPDSLDNFTPTKTVDICYDVYFLVFEFANAIRLRQNQVEIVENILNVMLDGEGNRHAATKKSPYDRLNSLQPQPPHPTRQICLQLMMGQGKTTVIGPLLATILGNLNNLIIQVVPHNLVDFTKKSLENRFAGILKRPIYVLEFARGANVTEQLYENIYNIKTNQGVIVCSPTAIKSLWLKFTYLLSIIWKLDYIRAEIPETDTMWDTGRRKALKTYGQFKKGIINPIKNFKFRITVPSAVANSGFFDTVINKVTKIRTKILPKSEMRPKQLVPKNRAQTLEEIKHELTICHEILKLLGAAVLLMDEVDTVLHPQKSELRWPVGAAVPVDLTQSVRLPLLTMPQGDSLEKVGEDDGVSAETLDGIRWRCAWHYLELLFLVNAEPSTAERCCICTKSNIELVSLKTEMEKIADEFRRLIRLGIQSKNCLSTPHFVILDERFYEAQLRELFSRWMAILIMYWGLPGIKLQDISLFLQIKPQDRRNVENRILKDVRFNRRPETIQLLNIASLWVRNLGKHVLTRIHRVHYGLTMTPTEAGALQSSQMALSATCTTSGPHSGASRTLLAVPFIGKDKPSDTSEFANCDVLIGFTILSYRFDGMRFNDIVLSLVNLNGELRIEQSNMVNNANDDDEDATEYPACRKYREWVESAGGRVKGTRGPGSSDIPTDTESQKREEQAVLCVLPLNTIDFDDATHIDPLYGLLKASSETINYFLFNIVFPMTLKSNEYQLVASGQHLGSKSLFDRKIGFSGTPSSLLPAEYGSCEFEQGADGLMFMMLISDEVTTLKILPNKWDPKSILKIAAGKIDPDINLLDIGGMTASKDQRYHALIDTGALVTGMNNYEASRILNDLLDDEFLGIAYFGDTDERLFMNRDMFGSSIVALECAEIGPDQRFTFYDQIHTIGQDILQDPLAVALITIGKDTTFRDLAQGAWRLRLFGQGQRVQVLVPPEIMNDARRRKLLWNSSKASDQELIINWTLVNSLRQYHRLKILSCKQSCEHLLSSVLIKSLIDAKSIDVPPIIILEKFEKLLVEGCRNQIPTILIPSRNTWINQLETLVEDNLNFVNSPVIVQAVGSDTLDYKLRLMKYQLKQLKAASKTTASKPESPALSKIRESTKSPLEMVFQDSLESSSSDESKICHSEELEDLDAEIEAEAEEEMEEEQEQEQEVEEEQQQEIVKNEQGVIPNLKYTRNKDPIGHWNLNNLKLNIKGPSQNIRLLSQASVYTKFGQLKLPFPEYLWATTNFHPPSWDNTQRRLTNVAFVLEIQNIVPESPPDKAQCTINATTLAGIFAQPSGNFTAPPPPPVVRIKEDDIPVDRLVLVQLLFKALKGRQEYLDDSAFWSLLILLNIIDYRINDINPVLLEALKRIVINLSEGSSLWTWERCSRVLFSNYDNSLLLARKDNRSQAFPDTSIFNISKMSHFVCLTLAEAEIVRSIIHRCNNKDRFYLERNYGIRMTLRSMFNDLKAIDISFPTTISAQRSEAFSILKLLSGYIAFKKTEQKYLNDFLSRLPEEIVLSFIQENTFRRRRYRILTDSIISQIINKNDQNSIDSLSAAETGARLKDFQNLLRKIVSQRSLDTTTFFKELQLLQNRITPKLSSHNILEDFDDLFSSYQPVKQVSVGTLIIWLINSKSIKITPRKAQNISVILSTAFGGHSIAFNDLQRLLNSD